MSRFDSVYARLPLSAQHAAVSAFGVYWHWLRFGPGYEGFARGYRERELLSATEWRRYVNDRTKALLTVASTQVPYYRETWTSQARVAARAGRLDEVPLTPKDPLRSAPESFLRDDRRGESRLVFHTSGSTGTPIASIWTRRELRNSLALREVRSANWAGVSFREERATFSGRMVVPDPSSRGPFHRFNRVERQVYLSAFHLRPETAPAYVAALRKHRVQWMTGYAVSYYLLAKFILEQGLEAPPIRAIVTTSEKVTPQMRATMERAFRCRVFEEYSTVENAMFASECGLGRLHVSEDAGVIEILRPDGTACEPDEEGEVVATCLMRDLQPLIRFRTSDVAAWSAEACPCGRPMPVIKEVVGRIEDVVIGPDGRQLVRFHGVFTDQPHVVEGQVVQEALARIRVRIVPVPGFGENDAVDIVRRVQQRLGPGVEVIVEVVARIPRTANGKFKAVVSLLRGAESTPS